MHLLFQSNNPRTNTKWLTKEFYNQKSCGSSCDSALSMHGVNHHQDNSRDQHVNTFTLIGSQLVVMVLRAQWPLYYRVIFPFCGGGKKKRWQKNKGILWLGYHRYSSKKPVSTVSKCSLVLTSYLFWSQNFLNEIAPSPFLILLKLRCNFCTEFQYLCLELCIKLGCEEGTVHVHWFLFVFDILIEKFIFLSWVKW